MSVVECKVCQEVELKVFMGVECNVWQGFIVRPATGGV